MVAIPTTPMTPMTLQKAFLVGLTMATTAAFRGIYAVTIKEDVF